MTKEQKKAELEAMRAIAAANMEDMSSHFFEIGSMGFNVFKLQGNAYRIDINKETYIFCIYTGTQIQVQWNGGAFHNFIDKAEAEQAINDYMKKKLGEFPPKLVVARLKEETPSTNYRSIASLIDDAEILAVCDPQLENASLTALIDICSFGRGKIAEGIRLMRMSYRPAGGIPNFTMAGINAFSTQTKVTATGKICTQYFSNNKFLLLSGDKCLVLGPSLNALHKNQAVSIEPDTECKQLFEKLWVNGVAV